MGTTEENKFVWESDNLKLPENNICEKLDLVGIF